MASRGSGERPTDATVVGRHPDIVRKESWLSEYKILLEHYNQNPHNRKDETLVKRLRQLREWLGDDYIQSHVERSEIYGSVLPV